MRNKRLFALATLAAAIALAGVASADVAVTTIVVDPNGGDPNTWEVRGRLWHDDGIGVAPVHLGFLDFVFYSVEGDGVGADPMTVTGSTNVAPESFYTMSGETYGAGYSLMRSDGNDGVGIMALQPAGYAPDSTPAVPTNDPTADLGIIEGIGVSDGTWTPPASSDANGGALNWEDDTVLATGTYSGTTGSLRMDSYGRLSFSILPDLDANGLPDNDDDFDGPVNNVGETSWVSGVVTQVLTDTGNNGGADGWDQPTAMTLHDGEYTMGVNHVGNDGNAAVALEIAAGPSDTKAVLTTQQDLVSVGIAYGADGNAAMDLNRNKLFLAPADGDTATVSTDVYNAVVAGETALASGVYTVADGLVDLTKQDTSEAIGWKEIAGGGTDANQVQVQLTLVGDVNLDETTDAVDLLALLANYNGPGSWQNGDFNRDLAVDALDLLAMLANYNDSFVATPSAPAGTMGGGIVPEPGTICLLLGGAGLALLRKRRT